MQIALQRAIVKCRLSVDRFKDEATRSLWGMLGIDAQTWINLQLAVDMYDAQHGSEAKLIAKLKPLSSGIN